MAFISHFLFFRHNTFEKRKRIFAFRLEKRRHTMYRKISKYIEEYLTSNEEKVLFIDACD